MPVVRRATAVAALLALLVAHPARPEDPGGTVRVQTAIPVRVEAPPDPPPSPPAAPAPAPPASQPAPEPSAQGVPAEAVAEPPLELAEAPPPAPGSSIHAGLLLTPLSVPRPVAIELFVRGGLAGAGFGYSLFPGLLSTTLLAIAGANKGATTVTLDRFDAWSGELRLFPGRGAFFLGAAAGSQRLIATLTRPVQGVPETVRVDLVSWFLTPRLGWLFRAESGFTLGLSLGLQLELASHQKIAVPDGATDTIKKNLDSLTSFVAGIPLPELALRAGYLF